MLHHHTTPTLLCVHLLGLICIYVSYNLMIPCRYHILHLLLRCHTYLFLPFLHHAFYISPSLLILVPHTTMPTTYGLLPSCLHTHHHGFLYRTFLPPLPLATFCSTYHYTHALLPPPHCSFVLFLTPLPALHTTVMGSTYYYHTGFSPTYLHTPPFPCLLFPLTHTSATRLVNTTFHSCLQLPHSFCVFHLYYHHLYLHSHPVWDCSVTTHTLHTRFCLPFYIPTTTRWDSTFYTYIIFHHSYSFPALDLLLSYTFAFSLPTTIRFSMPVPTIPATHTYTTCSSSDSFVPFDFYHSLPFFVFGHFWEGWTELCTL